jgi:two-component system, cell cycle response regulator DivK
MARNDSGAPAKSVRSPTASTSAVGRRRGSGREAPLVLVVDDYEDNRLMYSEYLSFAGFRVAEAVDGEDAVRKAALLIPDLVVMDLSLPGLDGWAATRAIKADARTSDVPVIALTGFAFASHAQRARDAGCDDFITKPCLPMDLVDTLEKHLRLKKPSRPSGPRRAERKRAR